MYCLGEDEFGSEKFVQYDLLTKSTANKSLPITKHDDFKLITAGRDYIFVVGMHSEKICEKYNVHTDEWTLLPSIPVQSLSSSCFIENNQYL